VNTDLPRLIEAIRRTLRDAVAPELTSDYGRGQMAAVQDILGKLAGMVVWEPDAQEAQAQALRAGCEEFRSRASRAGLVVAMEAAPAAPGPGAALLEAEAEVRRLIDWLNECGGSLDDAVRAELDAILCQMLREQLRVERKRIPLTDFGAMTAAAPHT
jgi:hypothetical protein